eukprot:2495365-Prymnesium_polylepis.1
MWSCILYTLIGPESRVDVALELHSKSYRESPGENFAPLNDSAVIGSASSMTPTSCSLMVVV